MGYEAAGGESDERDELERECERLREQRDEARACVVALRREARSYSRRLAELRLATERTLGELRDALVVSFDV